MLEWVCPRCDRAVDPGFDVCPFCGNAEATPPAAPTRRSAWAVLDLGLRWFLGLVLVVAVTGFVVFLLAYFLHADELLHRMLNLFHR